MKKSTDSVRLDDTVAEHDDPGKKETLISSLLGPSGSINASKGRVLISEVNEDPAPPPTNVIPPTPAYSSKPSEDEGPSLLEQMMAEARIAKAEKSKEKEEVVKKESSKGFNGFKKGFFGSSSSNTNKAKKPLSDSSDVEEVQIKPPTKKSDPNEKLVLEEVQQAMQDDSETNPILRQLRSNEWVTPDLTSKISTNPILAAGFKHPTCLAAIELMQKDPNEAMKRFKNDPAVTRFLQEFGKVMGEHFESIGSSNGGAMKTNQPANEVGGSNPIMEVGPLHAQAIKKQNEQLQPSHLNNKNSGTAKNSEGDVTDEKRVQQIINDSELRDLLMDPAMQQILVECGDPIKLRKHLNNTETARKIRKLEVAGLIRFDS